MAGCGGVGGGSKSGGGNSVGGSHSAGSVGNKSSDSSKSNSVGKTDQSNKTAKTNNTDGANVKNGINREPQQKADLNGKPDAAKTDQKVAQTKTEQTKAEKVKNDKVQAQSFTDKVKEKAKEVIAKVEKFAGTVKKEFDKAAAKVQKQKELAALANNPKIRAMLDTIGFTEGTGLNYGKVVKGTVIGQNKKNMGYDTTLTKGMKNVSTLDMSKHPNVKVQVNNKIVSSAAGRYQFLSKTWNNLSKKLGLTDFHATTQDIAAVELMKERNMIQPILDGDLKTAVHRGVKEWASLPKANGKGAFIGQNARSFNDIQRAYDGFLRDEEAMAKVGDFN
jgi:muramidase (phage lysozyme)